MKHGAKIIGMLILMSIGLYQLDKLSASSVRLEIVAAGVPKYWGETRDYDAWFAELSAAGITEFLPFSEYQELPEALYLGYEADFFPPCSYDDASFRALRAHQVKLVVAGEVLYAEGFPPLEDDLLRALRVCAGEGMISTVLSFDEPGITQIHALDPTRKARMLYERVKAIDPTLSVMMVHAPIPETVTELDGTSRPVQHSDVETYLRDVKDFSVYADIIGFDLYPIPAEFASLIAPNLGLTPVGYRQAFPAYFDWLHGIAEDKPYFLALQAFSYERELSSTMAQEAKDAGYELRFPTETELQDMACLAVEGGATKLALWGQSFLLSEDKTFWESVLEVSRQITTDGASYCDGRPIP